MDFDRLERRIGDPRYISGIYNYCDAWCQRCEFTTRCSIYVSPEEMKRETERMKRKGALKDFPEDDLPEPPPLAEPMPLSEPPPISNLMDEADPADTDIDEEDFEQFREEEDRKSDQIRNSPIGRAGWAYFQRVDAWLNGLRPLFNEEGELADDKVKAEFPTVASDDDLLALEDAIEVIRWYQHFISAKAHRALHGRDRDEHLEAVLSEQGEPFPRDSDGSAKVCLLGIDRSIEAWSTLRDLAPERSEGVLDILTLLNNLRHAMEEEFPNARAFVRPGFDEPLPPALPKRKRAPKPKGSRPGRPKRGKRGSGPRGRR